MRFGLLSPAARTMLAWWPPRPALRPVGATTSRDSDGTSDASDGSSAGVEGERSTAIRRSRTFVPLAGICVVLLTTGCGTETAPQDDDALRVAAVLPSAATDAAYSQSMAVSLEAAQAALGGQDAVELSFTENMSDVAEASVAIRDYAEQGYDLVIAHGVQFRDAVQEIAPDFPETSFAWGDGADSLGLANVFAYSAAAEEGGYVNGVMAALLSQSKTIGVTGPVDAGDAGLYVDGFLAGVAATDPDVAVTVTWTGSFSDETLMADAATSLVTAGADVLTGTSQSAVGAITAAEEAGDVLWFGTQSDQAPLAPEIVVASQVYDWSGVIEDMITEIRAGTPGGQAYALHLSNDGLAIVFGNGYSLDPDVKAAAEDAVAGIIDGNITVLP